MRCPRTRRTATASSSPGGVEWSETDNLFESDLDTATYPVAATFYLRPVELGGRPWEEAAFLGHQSSVSALGGRRNLDGGSFDGDEWYYGGAVQLASPDCPLTAGGGLLSGRTRAETLFGDVEIDRVGWAANAGYWILPGLLAGLRYRQDELDTRFSFGFDPDDRIWTAELFGKWVRQLEESRAFNLEVSAGRSELEPEFADDLVQFIGAVAGDFYFTPRLGLGAIVDAATGDDELEEGYGLGVRASGWFTRNIGLRLFYRRFFVSGSGDDDSLGAALALRF